MSDSNDDSKIVEAMKGTKTARNESARDNLRQSLAGWRRMAGMTLGFAVFLDLMFVFGGWHVTQYGDAGLLLGGTGIAIGLIGLLEKVGRRVFV